MATTIELDRTDVLIEPAISFTEIAEPVFNAAAWQDDYIRLLPRKVQQAAPEGEPDIGQLKLLTLDPVDHRIIDSRVVWDPEGKDCWYEDARAIALPNGIVRIGLTAVYREAGSYVTRPALVETSVPQLMNEGLPDPTVLTSMRKGDDSSSTMDVYGKNTTPLTLTADLDAVRLEGETHRLSIFAYDWENEIASHSQDINLEDFPSWGEFKVGTTAPPIWLNPREALFFLHGIRMVNRKYVYSIGPSRLFIDSNRRLGIDNIAQEPLITSGSYTEPYTELHPEKSEAHYMCGAIGIDYSYGSPKAVKLFASPGDTAQRTGTEKISTFVKNWRRG